jgi:uncharacterized protein (TIGR02147 family)
MTKQLPCIFNYLDFKKYLADYREMRKAYEPGFSHTYICYCLGQKNSKTYFANVISGIKNVTPEFANRFIDLLELNPDEANYFRALVNYAQTYNQKEKEYYLEQIIQRNTSKSRLISAQEYAFYKDWHHSVIRAILDVFDFIDDFKRLANMVIPPITVPQAKRSIKLLLSLNLIRPNEKGFLKPTEESVQTEEYVHDEIIKHHQAQSMEMAKLTLLGNNDQPTDYSTSILSISEEGLKKIQKRLAKFRDEIRALVHNDDKAADRVYHLDIQLFPNSKLPKLNARQDSGAGDVKKHGD